MLGDRTLSKGHPIRVIGKDGVGRLVQVWHVMEETFRDHWCVRSIGVGRQLEMDGEKVTQMSDHLFRLDKTGERFERLLG